MGLRTALGFLALTSQYLKESRKDDVSIPNLQKNWANETLWRFNVDLEIAGEVSAESPLIFVGNHVGYLDIPALMSAVKNVSFVAKKQLASWPVFGPAATAMDTIFVDRGKTSSRQSARQAIREGLLAGKRIIVFPSGTTTVDERKEWRYGVFEIAQEMGVKIQPFRLTYSPLRHTAYIDRDFFPWHLYNLARGPRIYGHIEFAQPCHINEPHEDCRKIQHWAQQIHLG